MCVTLVAHVLHNKLPMITSIRLLFAYWAHPCFCELDLNLTLHEQHCLLWLWLPATHQRGTLTGRTMATLGPSLPFCPRLLCLLTAAHSIQGHCIELPAEDLLALGRAAYPLDVWVGQTATSLPCFAQSARESHGRSWVRANMMEHHWCYWHEKCTVIHCLCIRPDSNFSPLFCTVCTWVLVGCWSGTRFNIMLLWPKAQSKPPFVQWLELLAVSVV